MSTVKSHRACARHRTLAGTTGLRAGRTLVFLAAFAAGSASAAGPLGQLLQGLGLVAPAKGTPTSAAAAQSPVKIPSVATARTKAAQTSATGSTLPGLGPQARAASSGSSA